MNTAENSTTENPMAEPSAPEASSDLLTRPESAVEAPAVDNGPGDSSEQSAVGRMEREDKIQATDAVGAANASGSVESPAGGAANAEEPEVEVAEPVAPKPAPVADEVLLAAVDIARAALRDVTPASTIGEPVGHVVEDDHVLSLLFATTLPGYPGWNWTVTLARVEDGEPMVLETELMPGDKALLAPEWVPWSERLADYRASQEAAEAESRALAEAAAELEDDEDDEDEGFSILHAGDLDGVDVDEIDPSEDDDSEDDDDESDDDDDESEDDDDESEDDDDESEDDDDESDDDDDSDDDESERTY
ncbi:hypothetical protein L1277_000250 [Okibacterium sp. HSC-33S16]|uniref:DUF3027 domain-containing protein n=1 Tax=Okibacterium sp. HSC-33S16 TaxID=2910965 RepID=UPI00209FECE1|nr:DUF3027 domain-containing protein [Okibacterium sp. HSC-33S16]MCP2030186.1 hypothetical protein [Okibacterium sp. HSC-33S16]